MPFRVYASVHRFRSDFVRDDYQRNLNMEPIGSQAVLPEKMTKDLAQTFETALSFEVWRRLRQDNGLTVDKSRAVVLCLAEALILKTETLPD